MSFNDSNTSVLVSLTPKEFLEVFITLYNSASEIEIFKKISLIFNILFIIFGVFGNFITICTFLNHKLREHRFNWYLLTIAILKLIFYLILSSEYLFAFLHVFIEFLNKTVDFIIHTIDSCISALTFFSSLDRLEAIKNPLKIKEFVTHLHAKFLIIATLTLTISLYAISFTICHLNINDGTQVMYCAIISPLVFHTVPLITVLVINVLLLFEKINYNKAQLQKNNENDQNESQTLTNSVNLTSFVSPLRKFGKTRHQAKKTQYYIIICLDLYSILTSIPYYTLNSVFVIYQMNFFYIETSIKLVIVSSILFNSNHCINFFMFMLFHDDFRNVIKNFFLKFFHTNNTAINT